MALLYIYYRCVHTFIPRSIYSDPSCICRVTGGNVYLSISLLSIIFFRWFICLHQRGHQEHGSMLQLWPAVCCQGLSRWMSNKCCVCVCTYQRNEKVCMCASVFLARGLYNCWPLSCSLNYFFSARSNGDYIFFPPLQKKKKKETSHSFSGKCDNRSEIGFLLRKKEKRKTFPALEWHFFSAFFF